MKKPFSGIPITFPEASTDIGIPHDGIGEIDFHADGKICYGIYRFPDENTVEVAEGTTGAPRPDCFDKAKVKSVWTARRKQPVP